MNEQTGAFKLQEYDDKIRKTLPFYDEYFRQILSIVKEQFDRAVNWLDIGCGTGKMAELAFKEFVTGKFVFCDISEDAIEYVRGRYENKNAEFIRSKASDLTLNDKFDVVTAIQVFHYLSREERRKSVENCYELLNKGGIFISFENFAPNSIVGKELMLKRWKSYQRSRGKSEFECEKHIGRYGQEYFPITILEHLALLKECGFGNSEVVWVSNMQAGFMGIK